MLFTEAQVKTQEAVDWSNSGCLSISVDSLRNQIFYDNPATAS